MHTACSYSVHNLWGSGETWSARFGWILFWLPSSWVSRRCCAFSIYCFKTFLLNVEAAPQNKILHLPRICTNSRTQPATKEPCRSIKYGCKFAAISDALVPAYWSWVSRSESRVLHWNLDPKLVQKWLSNSAAEVVQGQFLWGQHCN